MSNYDGIFGKPDKIVGGGKYVQENEHGHEACNFTKWPNGKVYGHVETIKGENDRSLNLSMLGANEIDDFIEGVDVVWVATNPVLGGSYIIGWYKNARVYRKRQSFKNPPTKQHKLDKIDSYRIEADFSDTVLLPIHERKITVKRGKDWLGQANWWYPESKNNLEVIKFLNEILSPLLQGKKVYQPEDEFIDEDESDFKEGKVSYKKHRVRERNLSVVKRAKEAFIKKHGHLFCECCSFDFKKCYGQIGEDFIEAHHTIPISSLEHSGKTKLEDIVLLCSNCHRMIHRRRPWLNLDTIKDLVSKT